MYDEYDDLEPNEDTDPEECPECGEELTNSHKCDNCGWEDEDMTPSGDDEEDLIDGVGFADPGGKSALRAATKDNPRNLPCPTCERPNKLTPADVARGYQCDDCAERDERGGGY